MWSLKIQPLHLSDSNLRIHSNACVPTQDALIKQFPWTHRSGREEQAENGKRAHSGVSEAYKHTGPWEQKGEK